MNINEVLILGKEVQKKGGKWKNMKKKKKYLKILKFKVYAEIEDCEKMSNA